VITVEHLTRRYADLVAVDDISFRVEQGEVVGFLGPNGAGKTTTMRMLTGFLPASSGRVTVAGYDMAVQSLEARRHIGYLPENVPLYPEMRVSEYLNFRGKLKGLGRRRRRERLAEVMELCGVTDVAGSVVGHLSKGYRQRVGLVDALLADPEILILDEPTIGLDPNQIRQVRQLIRDLAKGHTVILSTHILPEVEMTCGRVIIINRGRIAAMDSTQALVRGEGQPATVVALVRGEGEAVKKALAVIPGVKRVAWHEEEGLAEFRVEAERGRDVREAVFQQVARGGWALVELRQELRTLEEIFVEITAGE
jgi:ABC-2 type transport system ATP-binding protein